MADDSSKPKGGAPRPRRRRTASTAVSPDVTAALANGRQRSAEVKADADSAQARADAAKAISRRVTKALGQLKIAEELVADIERLNAGRYPGMVPTFDANEQALRFALALRWLVERKATAERERLSDADIAARVERYLRQYLPLATSEILAGAAKCEPHVTDRDWPTLIEQSAMWRVMASEVAEYRLTRLVASDLTPEQRAELERAARREKYAADQAALSPAEKQAQIAERMAKRKRRARDRKALRHKTTAAYLVEGIASAGRTVSNETVRKWIKGGPTLLAERLVAVVGERIAGPMLDARNAAKRELEKPGSLVRKSGPSAGGKKLEKPGSLVRGAQPPSEKLEKRVRSKKLEKPGSSAVKKIEPMIPLLGQPSSEDLAAKAAANPQGDAPMNNDLPASTEGAVGAGPDAPPTPATETTLSASDNVVPFDADARVARDIAADLIRRTGSADLRDPRVQRTLYDALGAMRSVGEAVGRDTAAQVQSAVEKHRASVMLATTKHPKWKVNPALVSTLAAAAPNADAVWTLLNMIGDAEISDDVANMAPQLWMRGMSAREVGAALLAAAAQAPAALQ